MSITSQSRRNPEGEASLVEHMERTFPHSLNDYMGKEHFWLLADRNEIRRAIAGKLFMELCFPVTGTPKKYFHASDVTVLDPATLGLNVSTRHETGLPYPPVLITSSQFSLRSSAHLGRTRGGWINGQPIADTVIQAMSVVEFATGEDYQNKALFTPAAIGALAVFAEDLLELC
jgi:hypothetical protein